MLRFHLIKIISSPGVVVNISIPFSELYLRLGSSLMLRFSRTIIIKVTYGKCDSCYRALKRSKYRFSFVLYSQYWNTQNETGYGPELSKWRHFDRIDIYKSILKYLWESVQYVHVIQNHIWFLERYGMLVCGIYFASVFWNQKGFTHLVLFKENPNWSYLC